MLSYCQSLPNNSGVPLPSPGKRRREPHQRHEGLHTGGVPSGGSARLRRGSKPRPLIHVFLGQLYHRLALLSIRLLDIPGPAHLNSLQQVATTRIVDRMPAFYLEKRLICRSLCAADMPAEGVSMRYERQKIKM